MVLRKTLLLLEPVSLFLPLPQSTKTPAGVVLGTDENWDVQGRLQSCLLP